MSSGARIQGEPAYLLHATAFGETSLLIEVFTPTHGRLGLMAKGARTAKSRLRASLQVGQPLELSWRDSGELATLHSAEASGLAPPFPGAALFCLWYLNELLMRLLKRRQAHPPLFLAYSAALAKLSSQPQSTLRLFETLLLEELGEPLILPESLDAAQRYRYDWEAGPLPEAGGREVPGQVACSGAALIALRDHDADAQAALQQSLPLLRAALQRQLGSVRLKTPALLRQLRLLE